MKFFRILFCDYRGVLDPRKFIGVFGFLYGSSVVMAFGGLRAIALLWFLCLVFLVMMTLLGRLLGGGK